MGPIQTGQTDAWISSDILIAPTFALPGDDESVLLSACPFENLEPPAVTLPCFLSMLHAGNFIVIYPEEQAAFSVTYSDPFGNTPSAGYPRLTVCREGTADTLTYTLDYVSPSIYRKTLSLTPGNYRYTYSVRNEHLTEDYSLAAGSFTVTQRPAAVENASIRDDAVVCNARIVLRWGSRDPEGGELHYRLRFGITPDSLSTVYEGNSTAYELSGLANRQRYYWQVEATNRYGASTLSALHSFSTVQQVGKPFNYPNPFNPAAGQSTNLVFNMPAAGRADIAVLTELGDLCWQRTFNNLLPGANEISYNGKDDGGNILYNGTYVCLIRKHLNDREESDKCRILVIK
jgi:hypothetical protein